MQPEDGMEQGSFNIIISVSVAAAAILATACAGPALRQDAVTVPEQDLLSGEVLFGRPIETASIPDPGMFELDEDMRAFVAEHVDGSRAGRERMRRLLSAMIESGLMSLDYDDAKTKTARRTFHDRVGNCMSFTALFVALAREANLDVTFQTVEVPPIWYADSDLVILNNHVNALVKHNFGSRVVVDFNVTELKGDYETREVSDEYALALYYNNVAMDALRIGDIEQSFRLLKKSIETYPDIAGNWANLGVIYSRSNEDDYAIAAFHKALDLDRKHRPSLTNLASIYQGRGESERAEYYARQVRRYQDQNPYYHYYHALAAYNNGDLESAEKRLARAIDLKDTEHKFFQLQGLIAEHHGDRKMALESFEQALDLAVFSDARRMYDNKISLLSGKR
jgi:Flp pilus assembly protein TadD